MVFKAAKLAKDGIPDGLVWPMIVGIITSAIAGWFAVWGTLKSHSARSPPFVHLPRRPLGIAALASRCLPVGAELHGTNSSVTPPAWARS